LGKCKKWKKGLGQKQSTINETGEPKRKGAGIWGNTVRRGGKEIKIDSRAEKRVGGKTDVWREKRKKRGSLNARTKRM